MKKYKIIATSILMGTALLLHSGLTPQLAFAKTFSELTAEFKSKPKGSGKSITLAKEISKLAPSSEKEIYELLELIKDEEGTVQEKLMASLGQVEDKKFGPIFVKELSHKHAMVRAVSAGMCGKLKVLDAEEPLKELIRKSPPIEQFPDTPEERAAVTAVVALGELGQDSSIDFLLSLLGTMKGYDVQALRKFGIKPLEKLIAKLNDSNTPSNAKMAVVQVIMSIEDKAALPMLRKEAYNVESKARPYAITNVLKLDQEKALPEFIAEWEKSKDLLLETRLLFFINNWRLGDARMLPFLVDIVQNSKNASSRRMAVVSLARIKDDKALSTLKQAAEKDEDKSVRLYANQALQMHHPDATSK